EHIRKDGTTFPLEVLVKPVMHGGIPAFLSIATDITERKKTEDALRKSEAKFRRVFESAALGMATVTPDGRFSEVNDVLCRILGYSRQELLQRNFREITHLDDLHLDVEYIRRVLSGEIDSFVLEKRFVRSDGAAVWCILNSSVVRLQDGTPDYAVAIIQDITDRRESEAERERLLTAIEQAGETIMITDPRGFIQYVNPAFERTSGYSWQEAVGQRPNILKSGEQDEAFYAALWQTLTSGRSWEGRMVNRRKDGTLYTEDVNISPVLDSAGSIVNFVAVKRDITRELEIERQYHQAQKMEAIGQLTGGVAHDFNNILQVINGATEMALTDLEPSHPARFMLSEVQKAGEKAVRLVEQLLLFSRRQIMRPKTTDLNLVIEDLLKMLRRIIGENIRLEWLPGKHLGMVHADQSMLEQVVLNLCVNARDAMPQRGVLTIETQNVIMDSDYCAVHTWASLGRYVLLSITDTGCGMDSELLEHIFEPFFTTKPEGKGSGLGLATVYGIVRQHEGMISAYSEPDKGSTFKVYLPMCERPAEAVGVMIQGEAKGGEETILLAEDDEMVRNLAYTVLSRAGYRVLVAKDGLEAVELFQRNQDDISAVVLDVVMPGLGGAEALKQMRALRPRLKALFASGYSPNAIHTNFILHEGVELLQKPYGPDALLRALRVVLDSR
ncbi:MAG TPA: PAS domain S-box protein, partial [bacterium]|nr:PAS domain S-box protein [bacterium]